MDFFLHVIISIGHWIPTALGYNLVFGKGKIFHFGPLGVSVSTAYAMFLTLIHTESFALALVAGLAMAAFMSLIFAWLSLRLKPDAMGVMSLAVHLAAIAVVLNWSSLTRGALGVPRIPRLPFLENMWAYAAVTTTVAVVMFVVYLLIDRSSFGRQVAALAEHEWHAKSLGINRAKVYVLSFLILGVSHVIGTGLSVQYLRFMHPNDFGFPVFIFLVMVVVAGKPGSVKGVTLAAVLLVVLKEALRFVPLAPSVLGPVRLMLFGFILFAAVWWRRDDLFPKQRSV